MYVDWAEFRGFVYDSWEPTVVQRALAEIKSGMTVIDIGAHIGYYTLLFAKYVGATGSVFSFEPSPSNFDMLARNVELNHLSRVRICNSAIFSRCGEISISIPDDSNSGQASLIESVGSRRLQVRSTTLDAACATLDIRPDFVKIDVEGSESDVLAGARETIRQYRPKMLIELHHLDGNPSGNPVPGFLTGLGYEQEWIERSALTSHILASPVS
jgi:FkbM family methyltransferase